MTYLFSCRTCSGSFSASDFYYTGKGYRSSLCKPCYKAWHLKRYTPAEPAPPAAIRDCAHCGRAYAPKQDRFSIYCSRTCRTAARHAQERAATLAARPARKCLHCGVDIPSTKMITAKFCSAECNSRAHGLKRSLTARGSDGPNPGYLRAAICERDKWRCGICAGPVDRTLVHPDPMCASLDHVVPVSEGGDSSPANLRLTHLVCNLRRGNRGGFEQLALA